MRFEDDEGRAFAYLDSGKLVLTEEAPAHFKRSDRLDLRGNLCLTELPEGLCVDKLFLQECTRLTHLPDGLKVNYLSLIDCTGITALPGGLTCNTLNLRGTRLRSLPDDLQVIARLDLTDCRELTRLPDGLRVGWRGVLPGTPTDGALILRRCTALELLPDKLDVCHLDLRGCTALIGWPEGAKARLDRIFARGCSRLKTLPEQLVLSRLHVTDCVNLRELPDGLLVSDIEIANTGLTRLPDSLREARLFWRGVPITPRIAFQPDSITAHEVLTESNSELRRVLLERVGLVRFLVDAHAEVLDQDQDAGGERKLLRVPIAGDEDLVYVMVLCPSTSRRYILRVPPSMRTCRQAIAWTAGFNNPDDYRPLIET